jgi:hypothetical protein
VTKTGLEKNDVKIIFLFSLLSLTLQSFAQTENDRSTTGPKPPKGVDVVGYVSKTKAFTVQKIISGVPAYLWKDGCGPTAVGMIAGYWDSHGFPKLLPGDPSTQTADVNNAIASIEHYNDYSVPVESAPPVVPDKSELPVGDEHANNCIADFMKTSQSVVGNIYGWSFGRDIKPSWENFIANKAPEYIGICNAYYFSSSSWDTLVSNIDRSVPMVFLVDTDGNGDTDHFITVNGYQTENGINYYGCYNTWDSGQHWYAFAQMATGVNWGVSRCFTFRISNNLPFAAGSITGPSTVCAGQSSVIYSVPLIDNAFSYIWTLPAGATGTSETNSILINYSLTAVSGSIKVKGLNNAGEGAESELPVTLNDIPATPVAILNNGILQSSISSGNQWYFNDIIIAGATNDSYIPSQNGNYYTVVTLNSCSSLPSNIIAFIVTGTSDIPATDKVRVYPNPTNGFLNISFERTSENYFKIELFNRLGNLLKSEVKQKNDGQIQLDLSGYSPGLYLLRIKSQKESYQISIIKK